MKKAAEFSTWERHAAAYRSTMVSVAVNFVLSVAQIVIGLFAQSQSLIADGFHSLSDLVADGVVLAANKISRAAADENHPYGHGRFETVGALLIGALLILAGLGMLGTAAMKFIDPGKIPQVHIIALWTALFVIASKEALFRYMLVVAKRVNSSMLVANAWHARSDAASSLVVALGISGNLMGYTFLDPLAAALVGFMICRTGGKFTWDAMARLADRGLSQREVAAVRATLLATPGVKDVHDLRTRYMGDDVLIDAHLLVDGRLSVSEAHSIAAAARLRVLTDHRALDVLVHIDPEDDSGGEMFSQLPQRAEILATLRQILDLEPDAKLPATQIHYLNDRIDLDIFLDDDSPGSTACSVDPQRWRDAAGRMKKTFPALRRVDCWRRQ